MNLKKMSAFTVINKESLEKIRAGVAPDCDGGNLSPLGIGCGQPVSPPDC